jgi:shikimate dehydrogenase
MAKQFAVIGSPIQHSKSPAIHRAAHKVLELDWAYEKLEVKETELETFLSRTALDGLSVTMPLKERAFAIANVKDQAAIQSGSVNTLVRTPIGWAGHNTDVFGLIQALRDVTFSKVLVLGSGATARNAVLAVSSRSSAISIALKARSEAKAEQLASWAQGHQIEVRVLSKPADLEEFDLVIATLPPKSDTIGWFTGSPSGALLDVAYAPWPSELAKKWMASGGNVISGLEMLIWQAIGQLRIFTNGNVAESFKNEEELADAMRTAALSEG